MREKQITLQISYAANVDITNCPTLHRDSQSILESASLSYRTNEPKSSSDPPSKGGPLNSQSRSSSLSAFIPTRSLAVRPSATEDWVMLNLGPAFKTSFESRSDLIFSLSLSRPRKSLPQTQSSSTDVSMKVGSEIPHQRT